MHKQQESKQNKKTFFNFSHVLLAGLLTLLKMCIFNKTFKVLNIPLGHNVVYNAITNQSTVSTAKRLASLFWDIWLPWRLILYIILSMAMKLHVYGNRSTMYMYVWSKQFLILYFKNLLFLFLVDFELRKSS